VAKSRVFEIPSLNPRDYQQGTHLGKSETTDCGERLEMSSFVKDATVVLVHGAWADGSSWSKTISPLAQAGLRVVSASLPLISWSDDVAALKRVVERADGPVILVAHAYAGAVIGGVDSPKVKSLVFVAALAPDEGETVADVFYRDEKHQAAPSLAPDDNGFIWMPDSGFNMAVAHLASAEENLIGAAVQRPISVHCIQEKVARPSWKGKPSWYLVAEEDRMINPRTQQFMAERMGAQVRSHAVDHSPAITAANVVVDVILEAANATVKG
jgi:pimeloyl-ACP methyl ester carboxylesterase